MGADGEYRELVVVDATTTVAGGYCAKLLGEAGAQVVHLEPPGGDPLRRWRVDGDVEPGTDGALFRYLHHGHRSMVMGTAGPAAMADHVGAVLAGADVVLTDETVPLGMPPAQMVALHPSLVVTAISPFGLDGPYAGRPASDLTVQAESGALGVRGLATQPPVQAGGRILEWVAGAYAAVGTLAAARYALQTGHGELVDLSLCEVGQLTCTLFSDLFASLRGRPPLDAQPPARSFETPSIEPTADGYVGFNTNTRTQFQSFMLMLEHPEVVETGEWAMMTERLARWDEWNDLVHQWTTRHTTAEVVDLASMLRIPVAPVTNGATVGDLDQVVARGILVTDPTGTFRHPRRPWKIDGADPLEPGPAPAPEDAVPHLLARSVPRRHAPQSPRARPLEGVRVLDLTAWWAGPAAAHLLALLGADVVHVESASRPDGIRMAGGLFADLDRWWERSPFFLQANTNKRGITLELGDPRGRQLALDLVRHVDVVIENFTPRVLDNFDLGWEVLSAANPGLVMVRMPAFGLDGPWRDRPGFAQTMEQVTGLAWLTGHVDDQPRIQRGPCDPNGGLHAAFATLVGLAKRDRTGRGVFVEAPMLESALNVAAEPVLEWSAYGNLMDREGNRSPWAAPQGVYRCAGVDQWLAVAVETNAQWQAFTSVIGCSQLAGDPTLSDLAGRRSAHDRLDAQIMDWAADQDVDDAVSAFIGAGVPAAAVVDPRATSMHPQMVHRGFFEHPEHPVVGRHDIPTVPFRYQSIDRWVRRPAPTMGQHNREILGAWLGLGPQDLDRLEADGVIGTRPVGL